MNTLHQEHNSVQAFRLRLNMLLGFTTTPFLVPFAIYSFIQNRLVMGLVLIGIVILSNINSYYIFHRQKAIISIFLYHICILGALLWGFTTIGVKVAYWSYPVSFIAFFLTDIKRARIIVASNLGIFIPCAFIFFPPDFAIRFAITYTMICYFGDLIASVLNNLQKQLSEQAVTDPLTGAYNRRHMQVCLMDAIEQHRRGLSSVSIIALDIDHFKKVNDSLGHEAGDTVLKGLVTVLNERARKLDMIFRTGGEEFIVLARNITPNQASIFAESLREHVEKAILVDTMPITISVGVANYKDGENMDAWLRRADAYLYEAKEHGRNQVWPNQT